MTGPAVTAREISDLIDNITSLSNKLPSSVPIAEQADQVNRALNSAPGESTWATFNRRFDILYAEHLRDENGRLPNICRGKYGMSAVCKYLSGVDWSEPDIPLELVKLKLVRVEEELKAIS